MLNKISFKEKPNLSQSCGLFVAALVLITGLILSFLSWSNLSKQLYANSLQSTQQQLQRLTIAIAPSLLLQDRISININLQEWTKASDINFIRVLNTNHQAIAEAGQHLPKSTEISRSITQDNLAIGTIKAEINFSKSDAITSRHLALGLTITALFTLLSGLVSYLLCEHYFNYLRRFTLQFKLWQADNNQQLVLPPAPQLPELSQLHQTISQLVKHQQQQASLDDALQLFGLSQPSVTKQLSYQSSALLFIEIKNIDELHSTLSPKELTEVLKRYNQLLVQACKLYSGRLERYCGNGVVAVFNTASNNNLSASAAQTAMHSLYAAQLFIGIVEQQRLQPNAPLVDFRLAGHCGEVLLPQATEPETEKHYLFSDSLHWASCLADQTEDLRLIVSQALFDQVGDNQQASWQPAKEVTDLYGDSQNSWYLQALEEKQQALIQRQIRHITTIL